MIVKVLVIAATVLGGVFFLTGKITSKKRNDAVSIVNFFSVMALFTIVIALMFL